jgi:HEAT repeats
LFGIALVGGVLALLFLHSFLQPVPSYGGKDANFWFDAYSQSPFSGSAPKKASASEAEAAFRNMGAAAAPFLAAELRRSDSWERWYATHRPGRPEWVSRILPLAKDWNGRRESAARLLVQLGPAATNAVPQLVSFYMKLEQRKAAASPIINTMGIPITTIMGPGRQRLYIYYPDETIRIQILEVLGMAGKNNSQALDTLARALQEQGMGRTTIRALVTLAKEDGKVVPRLVEELNSMNNLARSGAAEALGMIGSPARLAITRLKERVEEAKEFDREVRFKAADALWKIDHLAYAIVPFRIEELQNPSEAVRWSAAGFLGEYGTQSKPAVPALIEALKDKNNRVRGKVAMALGQIGPAAKGASPALKEALKDEYSNVREATEEALKRIESAEAP